MEVETLEDRNGEEEGGQPPAEVAKLIGGGLLGRNDREGQRKGAAEVGEDYAFGSLAQRKISSIEIGRSAIPSNPGKSAAE